MQNFYAIEIEAKFRRHDREQRAAADARAALAGSRSGRIKRLRLPTLDLTRLGARSALRVRLPDLCHVAERRDMPTT